MQIGLFGEVPTVRPTASLDELLAAAVSLWPERGTWRVEGDAVHGHSVTLTNRGTCGLSGAAWAGAAGRQVIEDNRLSAAELVAELRTATMSLHKALRERTGEDWRERVSAPHRRWTGPWGMAGLDLGGGWLVARRSSRTTRIMLATEENVAGWEVARGRLVALDLSRQALARRVRRADPGGAFAVELLLGRAP